METHMQRKPRQPHPALKDVLTATEAAAIKSVDHSSIVRAIQRGDLLADQRETGKKMLYLIHRRDLEAWTPERRGPKRADSSEAGKAAEAR
jgi:hypothetical protein